MTSIAVAYQARGCFVTVSCECECDDGGSDDNFVIPFSYSVLARVPFAIGSTNWEVDGALLVMCMFVFAVDIDRYFSQEFCGLLYVMSLGVISVCPC